MAQQLIPEDARENAAGNAWVEVLIRVRKLEEIVVHAHASTGHQARDVNWSSIHEDGPGRKSIHPSFARI